MVIPRLTLASALFLILALPCLSVYRGPLSNFIKDHDVLSYIPQEAQHRRVRRDVAAASLNEPVSLRFRALSRQFHLHLMPDPTIVDRNVIIEVSGEQRDVDHVTPVLGYMAGREANGSHVYGVLVNGIFRGSIRPGESEPGEYHVESTAFYEDPRKAGHHSVIYHDRHIDWRGGALRRHKRSTSNHVHCGRADPDISQTMRFLEARGDQRFLEQAKERFRRSTNEPSKCGDPQGLTCSLRLQSDTFLWDHIRKNVDSDESAVTEITSLFYNHVSVAKQIYSKTVFGKLQGRDLTGISFRVNRILINTTKDCESSVRKSNPFCADNVDVINFLNLNAFMDHSDFCLAYVFTYRDFQRGTLGLAWVGDANNAGGICEKYRQIPEGGVPVRKSLNTGVVTLLNYGLPVSMRVSQSTFAHEMGHNFGSTHDDDSDVDSKKCVPGASSRDGNFIMFSSATGGDKPNNLRFSECSKKKIASQLNLVINCKNSKRNCLVKADGAFCGNKLVEKASDGKGEECDCGFEDQNECKDVCCNPASSKNKLGCTLRKTVKGDPSKPVLCSPTAGECCNTKCQFKEKTVVCDHGHDCREKSYCSGHNASCILTDHKPNYMTTCMNNTRTCHQGECTASICKKFFLEECFVSYKASEKIKKATEMCYVACRNGSIPTAPCISTHNLLGDAERQKVYPELSAFLRKTKDMKDGIRMKPGAPCDNYRGYCDVFSRCRQIDADGPLTRLKNLIFSPRTLTVIREWIIQNWYYVMLMSLGVVLFMALFVKCCAVHTPSSNPNAPRARSITETLRRGPRRHRDDGRSGRGHRDERVELDAIGYRPGTAGDPSGGLGPMGMRGPGPNDRGMRYAEAPPPYDQATPGHGHGRGRRQQQHQQSAPGPQKPQPKPRKKKGGKGPRA